MSGVVCVRCGRHTGNSNVGHFYKHCFLTDTSRRWHYCCPDDCELGPHEEKDDIT